VQLTDFAGVRMVDGASARMSDCRFEHNGLMGGSAVKLSSAAQANVSRTTVVSGKSVCGCGCGCVFVGMCGFVCVCVCVCVCYTYILYLYVLYDRICICIL
jgi:hypothetical protein